MSSGIDEAIKEIAVKHGISIGRDDPILVLQTMQERLIEQNKLAQKELLEEFKSEIVRISNSWQEDTKSKAERILNSALSASKSLLDENIKCSISECVQQMKLEITKSVNEIRQLQEKTKKVSAFNLILSVSTILTVCILIAYVV